MRILFVGDVVGQLGLTLVQKYMPALKHQLKPQVTIINGENIADGKGITERLYKALLLAGADVVTLGNHAFRKRETVDFIGGTSKLIRPANFPPQVPGAGYTMINVNGVKLAVVNLQGRVFLDNIDDPFQKIDALLTKIKTETNLCFVDFHGEATSEKLAFTHYVDGRVTAVVGTHTHVQTNDARILAKGTAYLSDVGMVGSYNGILGVKPEPVLHSFLTNLPSRFEPIESGPGQLGACYIDLDATSGKAKKIQAIRIDPDHPLVEM
ncbi:TIGR00282 family metallophosphoesterase [Lactobacillus sp. CC-MHH1034]|uniref:TIGR00282 family metallophosphoesterase n=1 Tax=Agrilactobacillus fermenti TaxID=2586909 RepID=UPI001E38F657|nr:TIGR00282 family metallophosphoesterase [Agrilactobacillus fermenti]MCD2256755.1 TIGR00282 family metallophosphoesterase [Agrilactobacillus fermenti]